MSTKSAVFVHFAITIDGKYFVCQCIIEDVCNARISCFYGDDKNIPLCIKTKF